VPTLLLNHPIAFPVALLRAALNARLPGIAWRVGEEDFGGCGDVLPLERPQTIIGRTDQAMIMVSVELRHLPYQPANGHIPPAHMLHIAISRASTESDRAARLIALVVGTTLAAGQDESAQLQLEPGENWLDMADMRALLRSIAGDPDLLQRSLHGVPERFDSQGDVPAPAPAPGALRPAEPAQGARRVGGFGRKGL
jgi:hypothetical protein